MDIIIYTFIQLLRAGAYGMSARVRQLSPYKWSKIAELSSSHDVTDLIWNGLQKQTGNPFLNIPVQIRDEMAQAGLKKRQTVMERYSLSTVSLPGKKTKRALQHIIDETTSKEDVTPETLLLFGQIGHNTDKMLNKGFSLRGIIDLGLSLRSIGDKVDYILIDRWLEQTSMRRMAQLQASILIDLFDFESDEFPFIHHQEKEAGMLAVKCLSDRDMTGGVEDMKEEGYISDNKNRLTVGVHRMMTYFRYSPSGSIRSMLDNMADGLSQIEE